VIEVQDRGLQERIVVEEEDGEVTTDSGDDTEESFNYDAEDIESEFDKEEDSDEEEGDYFID
jgi:hypothetical protein